MTETVLLLLAIAAATLVALVAVAFSLARVGPPAAKARALPARVLCPATGTVARVEIGFDRDDTRLAVTRCEHAPDGVFTCERECFPALVLAPLSFAPASAS